MPLTNNFEAEVQKYHEVDTKHKELDKDRKLLNTSIKRHLEELGTNEVEVGNLVVKRGVQERTSMDNDKAVEILKQRGMTNAIRTIEVPDEEALDDLIYSGELQPSDLAPAITVKEVITLSVKPKKQSKAKKGGNAKDGKNEVF